MTAPQDPAGLLERIPDLSQFLDYPAVARAIERGDAHAVYRALWFGKVFGPLRDKRAAVEAVLARRRLFLTPLKRSPMLSTLNGIGAKVYGSSEQESDGTYIKSHYLVFAFIPLVPLSQYLVLDAPDGKGWHFIGKVPLNAFHYVWRRIMSLSALAALLWGGYAAFYASRHNDLHLVNGLPISVQVKVANQTIDLETNQRKSIELPVGIAPIEVRTRKGVLIETGKVSIKSGVDVLAWNVAGAAPIYREGVIYSSGGNVPNQSEPTVECGKQGIELDDVDYEFVEAPSTIKMDKGTNAVTKWRVAVADGGARSCLNWLDENKGEKAALALAVKLAELKEYEWVSTGEAAGRMANVQGPDAAIAWMKGVRDQHDKQVDLHRVYQELLKNLGKLSEAVAEYRARHQQRPADLDATYLLGRIVRNAEARGLYEAVLAKDPNHFAALRGLMSLHVSALDFEKALTLWDKMVALDAHTALESGYHAAFIYGALGQAQPALALLERTFQQSPDQFAARYRVCLAYARIAAGAGSGDPLALQRKMGESANTPLSQLWTRARAGIPVPEEELSKVEDADGRSSLELLWLAPQDPVRALAKVEALTPEQLGNLEEETWTLLYAEALRRDREGKAAQLLGAAVARKELLQSVAAYLSSGTEDAVLEDLDLSSRAALQFVRSRSADLSQAERTRLRATAEKTAAVPGIVKRALTSWES